MRVFVYEHMTATGAGREPGSPDHGMYREGRAMRDAVADDLARIPGVSVRRLPDDNEPCTDDRFLDEIQRSDHQLVIAPELGGTLQRLTRLAWTNGRPLGSSVEAVELTSDKLALFEHWRGCRVRTPATTDRDPTACDAVASVLKPRYGVGSTATFRLDGPFAYAHARAELANAGEDTGPMILQEFVPGHAASVALLCAPGVAHALLPAFQLLSDDGRFRYRGGELPMPAEQAERAEALARRAVECVPGLRGYVGVDLVLGDADDGSRDYAIEINPRLTTSYLGLRAMADFNLAEVLLRVATGKDIREMRWKTGRVRFGPDGVVQPV